FGIVTLTWVRPFLSEHVFLFERARKCGFGAIEIAVSDPDVLDLQMIRGGIEESGLSPSVLVMLEPDADISSRDAWRRDRGFQLIRRSIEAGGQLGAQVVGGPLYGDQMYFAGRAPIHLSADDRARKIDYCVENLRRLA